MPELQSEPRLSAIWAATRVQSPPKTAATPFPAIRCIACSRASPAVPEASKIQSSGRTSRNGGDDEDGDDEEENEAALTSSTAIFVAVSMSMPQGAAWPLGYLVEETYPIRTVGIEAWALFEEDSVWPDEDNPEEAQRRKIGRVGKGTVGALGTMGRSGRGGLIQRDTRVYVCVVTRE
mmetsp:Transcript_18398/g.45169  ORF Transcript_18398/g.45169 Transcript_18398/m.45169 type:complete len:178 (+) Transcript_18398:1230-1763(+)